jgi:very-short-patch-repair endonuclease
MSNDEVSDIYKARLLRRNQTEAEQILWSLLRNRALGCKFRRQHPIGRYIIDFVCLETKLIIEIDGGHHLDPDKSKNDKERTLWLQSQGYTILRFWNSSIIADPDSAILKVREILKSKSPSSQIFPLPTKRS